MNINCLQAVDNSFFCVENHLFIVFVYCILLERVVALGNIWKSCYFKNVSLNNKSNTDEITDYTGYLLLFIQYAMIYAKTGIFYKFYTCFHHNISRVK